MIVRYFAVVMLIGMCAPGVLAQAPLNANVALQPPKGILIFEQKFRFDVGELPGERDAERIRLATTLVYGLTDSVTAIIGVPLVNLEADDPNMNEFGVDDIRAMVKIRLHRNDFGPVRTSRFDLLTGVELPSGDDPFTSDSVDPLLGGVYTLVVDRHAFHVDALWRFSTGDGPRGDDSLFYNLSYVFRLSPSEYGEGANSSVFGVFELNGRADANGDQELVLAPGLAHANSKWAAGVNVNIPVYQDIDNRFERRIGIGLTFRMRF